MADPGFPRGGGANSRGGAPTYDFTKFSQKLHLIERIWTPQRGRASLAPPLDPPLKTIIKLTDYENITFPINILLIVMEPGPYVNLNLTHDL